MPSNNTTTKFSADVSNFKTGMQQAQRAIKLVNSEFRAATAGMDDWQKSEDGLNAKIKQLNSLLEQQKKKLALLNDELKRVSESEGADSAAADRLRTSINNQQAAINKTEKELKEYSQTLADLPRSTEEAAEAAKDASDGFTVFKAALADLVADGIKMAISACKDLAKEAIQVGMDFEKGMSQVAAVSGASAEEMQQLTDKAKEMGESTKFSATESAEAFNYMAMAGWKTEEMLDGIEGIMNLAAASGADLATTSDIVTDALTAMGYKASDAGRLADVMAAASSNANTNVEMMGSTFQYVAPLIGALGMNMEDTAVAIGLMANAGIKGDKAGTALRSTLNRLAAPPKQCAEEMEKLGLSLTDSDGKMKSLNQVIIDLRQAFKGLSETEATAAAKHIAGAEAMSGFLAIVNASDQDFQKLTSAINNSSGAAKEMADTMNDNVGGQLTLLKSKVEGIMIKLFERASDSMKQGIKTVGEALDKVDWDNAGDAVGKFATKAADFFAYIIKNSNTIITVLKTIGALFATVFVAQKITATMNAVSALVTVFHTAESATSLLSSAMGLLGISMSALPVMALVAALGALVVYGQKNRQEILAQIQATYGLSESQKKLIESINETSDSLKQVSDARREEGESIDANFDKIENMRNAYNDLIDENGNVKSGYEDLAQELLGNLASGLGMTIESLKENIDLNGKLGASIDELIAKKKAEAKLAAYEDDYQEARKKEVETWHQLTDAKNVQKEAQAKLNEATEEYNNLASQSQFGDVAVKTAQAKVAMEEASKAYAEASEGVKTAGANWAQTQSVIENYDKATEASLHNNVEVMEDSLNRMQNSIVNYGAASKEQLEEQVRVTNQNLEQARQDFKDGIVGEDFVASHKAALDAAISELNKFGEAAGESGKSASENFKGGIGDAAADIAATVSQIGSSSYNELNASIGDWSKLGSDKSDDLINELNAKMGVTKEAGSNIGKAAGEGAKDGSPEFKAAADEVSNEFTSTIDAHQSEFITSGVNAAKAAASGAEEGAKDMEKPGQAAPEHYNTGINSRVSQVEDTSKSMASSGAKAADSAKSEFETSGSNAGEGYNNGLGGWIQRLWDKGKELAKAALGGLKEGQQEGSPSKLTFKSGEFFGEGYEKGIEATKNVVKQAAVSVAKTAISELKKAQKEGSPSKLTYESGKMFTQGFINGIASLQTSLVATTKNLVNAALAELLKLKNFNFDEVTQSASEAFSAGIQKNVNYMINRIQYANQKQLKDFDNTIESLQEASDKATEKAQNKSQKKQDKLAKKIEKAQEKNDKKKVKSLQKQVKNEQKSLKKATEKINNSYEAQIKEQQQIKESYQEASQAMISEFTAAVNEYEAAAQKLIDSTMNKISSDYQSQYDALISKQDNLIQKLKEAGSLFNISSANVMTINDLQAQTQAIKEYASKLEQIKNKVSSDLFDEIASFDIKEGNAFMDRLLAMSDAEIKAYSDAYDEKMSVAESLSKNIYKKDFDTIASNYEKAMKEAFSSLPKQLEELGWQTMQGFLSGLTQNTEYMEASVRTFIAGMVDTFKQQLGIHSPSKVGISLGENFGGAFADGLLEMVNAVKKAAQDITDTVTQNLDISDSLNALKSVLTQASGAAGYNRNAGSFVGDRTQIINFNQTNNSPKALDRLTIYRQTNTMLFNAKVGLSNV